MSAARRRGGWSARAARPAILGADQRRGRSGRDDRCGCRSRRLSRTRVRYAVPVPRLAPARAPPAPFGARDRPPVRHLPRRQWAATVRSRRWTRAEAGPALGRSRLAAMTVQPVRDEWLPAARQPPLPRRGAALERSAEPAAARTATVVRHRSSRRGAAVARPVPPRDLCRHCRRVRDGRHDARTRPIPAHPRRHRPDLGERRCTRVGSRPVRRLPRACRGARPLPRRWVVTVFTLGPPVISGVDTVLRVLTTEALKGLTTPVGVTVGPLDRPVVRPGSTGSSTASRPLRRLPTWSRRRPAGPPAAAAHRWR